MEQRRTMLDRELRVLFDEPIARLEEFPETVEFAPRVDLAEPKVREGEVAVRGGGGGLEEGHARADVAADAAPHDERVPETGRAQHVLLVGPDLVPMRGLRPIRGSSFPEVVRVPHQKRRMCLAQRRGHALLLLLLLLLKNSSVVDAVSTMSTTSDSSRPEHQR